MADLFKKLQVLIRASLNDLLSDESARSRPDEDPRRVQKEIERELTALRERIHKALDYESRLQEQVKALEAEAQQFHAQVEKALRDGRDDQARIHQEQVLRASRGLEMTRSDLREHQRVTRDLIQRVNTLEAYIAEVKRRNQHEQDAQDEKIARRSRDMDETGDAQTPTQTVSQRANVPAAEADEELDNRRRRLMRPADPDVLSRPPTT
ncbi:MAG: hypothetical protein NZM00_08445 [Anaerolinea sp.]|nr:hypothetical protein [Anaerolinea sp.]